MYRKDHLLLEEAYQQVLLKEDPDFSFSPLTNTKLKYNAKDAIPFGWIDLSKENPLYTYDSSTAVGTMGGFGPEWKNTLLLSNRRKIHNNIFDKVLDDIEKNNPKQGLLTAKLARELITINFAEKVNPEDLKTVVERIKISINPRRLMNPCGRIWMENRVVSFWNSETEVLPNHLMELFDKLNIPREQLSEYYIEFPADIKPHQTAEQYIKGSTQYSKKEQEARDKKAAEIIAKAHEQAAIGTKDKDVQKIIDDRKKGLMDMRAELEAGGQIRSFEDRWQMGESFKQLVLQELENECQG